MRIALRRITRTASRAIHGNPVVRSAKNLRNGLVDGAFRRAAAARGRRLADELVRSGVREAAFTIAFNTPWAIDLLTHQWSRHHPDLRLVVIDNSSDRSARAEHDDLCRQRRVPYLPLPRNPEWSPNRSHGIALNWVWFNVVRHAGLDVAGFIDHDCVPVASLDLRSRLNGLAAYGMRGASLTYPQAWNLWAGYCFFKPAAADGLTVDFKHRIELGLDTGGGNWAGFYRHLDPASVGEAGYRVVQVEVGDGRPPVPMLLLDEAFLHLDGASYREAFRDASMRRRLLETILAKP